MKAQTNQFIGCDKPYEDATTVLFGAPYDSTTSFRPGTRFGPNAMRMESFGIETYSMLLDRDLLDDTSVFDSGDLELPFGDQERVLSMIEERADEILTGGKRPFLLGGEHLVTLGSVRAVAKRHPDLHIIHFDAHADLREDYLGNPLSHPVCCVAAMTCSAMAASSSSASVRARARNASSCAMGTSRQSSSRIRRSPM